MLLADSMSYQQSISNQVAAILDLREVELGMKVSQRFFGVLPKRSNAFEDSIKSNQSTVALELARNYFGQSGIFGRMGLEWLHYFPSQERWARLSVTTGIFPPIASSWEAILSTQCFFSLDGKGTHLLVKGEASSPFAHGSDLSYGGFLNWNYRLRETATVGKYEHMLFSFGPSVSWQTKLGKLRLLVPFRMWLDHENEMQNGSLVTAHATEFSLDVALSWALLF